MEVSDKCQALGLYEETRKKSLEFGCQELDGSKKKEKTKED